MMSIWTMMGLLAITIAILLAGAAVVRRWNEDLSLKMFTTAIVADLGLCSALALYGILWISRHLCY